MTFLDLPTELLCRILSYLPAVDLYAAQRTCHRINTIITDTVYFQYTLRAHINGVEDLLPPDYPFCDRIELLKQYEKSWNGLQLDKTTKFPIHIEAPNLDSYTLQDGYLVYVSSQQIERRYSYLDLFSTIGNKEAPWVHISMPMPDTGISTQPPTLTFAADHDLGISLSISRMAGTSPRSQPVLSFFQFTTGAPHPLASEHVVWLPQIHPHSIPSIEIEVLGDYILVSEEYLYHPCPEYQYRSHHLRVVSWKTGAMSRLRELPGNVGSRTAHKPLVIDPHENLIALAHGNENRIEICKLEIVSRVPRLQTLCLFELPPLKPRVRCVISAAEKEWVPTSRHQDYTQSSRQRLVPFRSCRIGTLFFSVDYNPSTSSSAQSYGMIVNIAALLSAVRSDRPRVRTIPWAGWGPAATRVFPLRGDGPFRCGLPCPAGPFWIMEDTPRELVIQDFDLQGKWQIQATTESASSVSRQTTKVIAQHWGAGKVKTHLPYRDVVTIDSRRRPMYGTSTLIDREWFIRISRRSGTSHIIVHHIG